MIRAGRGRYPQADMDACRVLGLSGHLQANDSAVWLDGGWAIDALLGEQTRAHDDLDLIARLEDCTRIETALSELGYLLEGGGAPHSFELIDLEGHQVDVHPVAFNADGVGIYKMASGADWILPADGFYGTGRICGREVPCLTPEVVLVNHSTGYVLDESHQRDVLAIAQRYRLPFPDFLTS